MIVIEELHVDMAPDLGLERGQGHLLADLERLRAVWRECGVLRGGDHSLKHLIIETIYIALT